MSLTLNYASVYAIRGVIESQRELKLNVVQSFWAYDVNCLGEYLNNINFIIR